MGDLIDELKRVDFERPIVFISYAGEELALADFIRDIISRLTEFKVEAFVAKRDIPPGDNPLKTMMEEKLKNAKAIIPICSVKSKMSSWVWWESAAVWAKDKKVYPLFTNISASDFGAPLTLVSQGKEYFIRSEFIETVRMVCEDVGTPVVDKDLTKEEWDEYEKLKTEYSKPETSAKVTADYKKLEMTQDLHKYSFVFEIENRNQKRFDDVDVELYFPVDYIEEKKWEYPHLRSSTSHDKPGYLCLTFSFSGLPETAKKQFISSLLPGKKLKVFGEDGMTKLHYYMDHDRWDKRFKYDVQWKVYINGGAPQEGSIPLNSIQYF
ncbi:MAG: toll/interleukin-1 receptor domain-containing protein [Candidatus Omnitrophota bacterium]